MFVNNSFTVFSRLWEDVIKDKHFCDRNKPERGFVE